MSWAGILVALNVIVAAVVWVGKNDWFHKYLRAAGRLASKLNPWSRTNELLNSLLAEVKDSSGQPLRAALEHLGHGLQSVQATLAIIHVRQRLYDRLLESATLTTNANGEVTWASEGLLEIAGCTLQDMQGDGWINAIHQDDRAMVKAEWERAVRDGTDFVLTYRYRNEGDRREKLVEAHAYAARALPSQPPVGWVAVVRRVDLRRRPDQSPIGRIVEPRVRTARMRLDSEMGCYHPATGEEEAR
jgi:PAS domain-containing protein